MKHLEQTPQQFVHEYVETHPNCCLQELVGEINESYEEDTPEWDEAYELACELREDCTYECDDSDDGCPYAAV